MDPRPAKKDPPNPAPVAAAKLEPNLARATRGKLARATAPPCVPAAKPKPASVATAPLDLRVVLAPLGDRALASPYKRTMATYAPLPASIVAQDSAA